MKKFTLSSALLATFMVALAGNTSQAAPLRTLGLGAW